MTDAADNVGRPRPRAGSPRPAQARGGCRHLDRHLGRHLGRHVVVLVRAGELGRVKRRLAAGIGAPAALAFHRRTVNALLRRLAGDRRWRLWLAVTPDRYARAGRAGLGGIRAPGVPRLAQGGGDLGARMGRVFGRLAPGPAVIVGGDIPEITAAHIARAFRALGRADAVFGPADDGGYWLIGLARRPAPPRLFRGVRWSGPHALADTLANLDARRKVAFIDRLEDVDDAPAYRRWRARARRGQGAGGPPPLRRSLRGV